MVKRIFVEKRNGFDIPAQSMLEDFRETIGIKNLKSLRLFVRYDIEDLSDEDFLKVRDIVFREPNVDNFFEELPKEIDLKKTFAIEYLPGVPILPLNAFSLSREKNVRQFTRHR